MSPVPPIVHLLGLVVGLFAAFALVTAVAPDIPDPNAALIKAGDSEIPGSRFVAENLTAALHQLGEKLPPDVTVWRMRIESSSLKFKTRRGPGVLPEQIGSTTPGVILDQISKLRGSELGVDDIQYMEMALRRTTAPIWTIQTTPEVDPPQVYYADFDGSDVRLTRKPSPGG